MLTNVQQSTISKLRNGTQKIENLSLKTAEALGKIYDSKNK